MLRRAGSLNTSPNRHGRRRPTIHAFFAAPGLAEALRRVASDLARSHSGGVERRGARLSGGGLRGRRRVAAAIAAWALATPAAAHPHIWITGTYGFEIDADKRLAALDVAWTFDAMSSSLALGGLEGPDGGYPQDALDALARDSLAQLAADAWWTYLVSGAAGLSFEPPEGATASVEDGQLTIRYRLRMTQPADVAASPVVLQGYDPSYYTEIRLRGLVDVALTGEGAQACRAEVQGPSEEALALAETKNEADWNALAGMGAAFADTVTLRCG